MKTSDEEFMKTVERDMDEAFDEVFSGERGDRLNKGEMDNHCNEKIHDYFSKLIQNDEQALKKQEARLKRLREKDLSWL